MKTPAGHRVTPEWNALRGARCTDEDAIASFYEIAVERWQQRTGRYEISNFARRFESLHNMKYWRREPYAGFARTRILLTDPSPAECRIGEGICRGVRLGQKLWTKRRSPVPRRRNFSSVSDSPGRGNRRRRLAPLRRTFERFLADGVMERSGSNLR